MFDLTQSTSISLFSSSLQLILGVSLLELYVFLLHPPQFSSAFLLFLSFLPLITFLFFPEVFSIPLPIFFFIPIPFASSASPLPCRFAPWLPNFVLRPPSFSVPSTCFFLPLLVPSSPCRSFFSLFPTLPAFEFSLPVIVSASLFQSSAEVSSCCYLL
jgi:hypothetical protein